MIVLTESLAVWGSAGFKPTLERELAALPLDALPLQQALTSGSYALEEGRRPMLISCAESPDLIRVKVGIFYQGVIAGCSCADDPTPLDTTQEYCELELQIDRGTGRTQVTLLTD